MRQAIFFFVSILLPFLTNPLLFAEPIDMESTITEVTVFPNRALVTRRAEVKLPEGRHTLQVPSLPGTVKKSSVQAKGVGESTVKIFGIELKVRQLEEAQSPQVKEIQDKIRELRELGKSHGDSIAALNSKRKFLESIQAATADQIGKDIVTKIPAVAEVGGLANYIENELRSIFEKNRKNQWEIKEIDLEIDKLNRELQQVRNTFLKQDTTVQVDVEAESEGLFVLDVSYQVPGASWSPFYEARVQTKDSRVEMISYGLVQQKTGEDWNDVAIRLSTARLSLSGRMPEVQPWYIGKWEPVFYREQRMRTASIMPMGAEELELAEESFSAQNRNVAETRVPIKKAEVAQAAIEAKGPAVHYILPKTGTILSDWQPHKVSIGSQNLEAALNYETAPRLSPFAYSHAKVKNSGEGVLLPGEVQIFSDGAYVGDSSIDLIGPEEEFDLYLGVDERIRVERKQLKAKEDVSLLPTMLGRIKTVEYVYWTTVENFSQKNIQLTVINQVPVSQHDEIKVEQVSFEPQPTEAVEDKPGIHRWNLTLEAGEQKRIRIAYRLKHPVDFVIADV